MLKPAPAIIQVGGVGGVGQRLLVDIIAYLLSVRGRSVFPGSEADGTASPVIIKVQLQEAP